MATLSMNSYVTTKPESIQIQEIINYRETASHSFRRIVQASGAHRWQIRFNYKPMTRTEAAEVIGYLSQHAGPSGVFFIRPWGLEEPAGACSVISDFPCIKGGGQTGTAILTDGWRNSITGLLKAGDFIRFQSTSGGSISGDGSKMYMVTQDVSSNASGEATININCPIMTHVDNGTLRIHDVPCKVSLMSPLTFNYDAAVRFGFSIDFLETVRDG